MIPGLGASAPTPHPARRSPHLQVSPVAWAWMATAFLCAVCASSPAQQAVPQSKQPQERQSTGHENHAHAAPRPTVALTLDDLPTTDERPPQLSRAEIAGSIIRALQSGHAPPTYGFANAGQLADGPRDISVIRMWRAAGFPIGNHTYSHMDLGAKTAAEFEQDIAKDEPLLREQMASADWHWFRYPYLQEGDTLEKRREVRHWLAANHYRIAEVSISFDDWAWNDPYTRCLAQRDTRSLEWLKSAYMRSAAESLSASRRMSQAVYGRDIPYVMLLHIGAFETVMLPRLLDLLRRRGFALVPLEQAESDPAYSDDPDIALKAGTTFLAQLILARGLPPEQPTTAPLKKLENICAEPATAP